jgi:Tfp pilus assembly protein PilO
MKLREFLPSDWKQLVRILVALIIIKVIVKATYAKLPPSVQPYIPLV